MFEEVLKSFHISDSDLLELENAMRKQLDRGLCANSNASAEIKMLPTYVVGTPNGEELGEFLALDLGGTNFRILLVKILNEDGKKEITMDAQVYQVSNELMTGTGKQLFDFMVDCLWKFLVNRGMMCQLLPIGFTFSFPTQHLGIDKTILLRWTKGYTATGVEGEDIGKLLNEAINRKFKIRCLNFDLKIMSTVVNDTVGTLESCGYDDNNTCMGMIVGTGTNMCYMECQSNIELLDTKSGDEMCINTEWGAFGDNSLSLDKYRTIFDKEIDSNSPNSGEHLYEKMMSGMYLGDLARRVIVKLSQDGELFDNLPSDSILHNAGLSTAFVSQVLNPKFDQAKLKQYLTSFVPNPSNEDCQKVKQVCAELSKRAAHLCAIGVITVAKKIREKRGNDSPMTCGVDGSVYRRHPTFADLLHAKVKELAPDLNLTFRVATDGSGRGAALVAAVECRLKHIKTMA